MQTTDLTTQLTRLAASPALQAELARQRAEEIVRRKAIQLRLAEAERRAVALQDKQAGREKETYHNMKQAEQLLDDERVAHHNLHAIINSEIGEARVAAANARAELAELPRWERFEAWLERVDRLLVAAEPNVRDAPGMIEVMRKNPRAEFSDRRDLAQFTIAWNAEHAAADDSLSTAVKEYREVVRAVQLSEAEEAAAIVMCKKQLHTVISLVKDAAPCREVLGT